jgi:hypothetical protein
MCCRIVKFATLMQLPMFMQFERDMTRKLILLLSAAILNLQMQNGLHINI